MRTIEVTKIHKWWYVIVKNEEGKNLVLANFTTKKSAVHCRDLWVAEKCFGELAIKK